MKYSELFNQNPREHTALEAMLLDKKINSLIVSTFPNSVFIGYELSSNLFNWENTDGVILARYIGTGGPVYFGQDTMKFIFTLDFIENGRDTCSRWITESFNRLGVETTRENNDVFINGKKFCGIGYREDSTKIIIPFFITLSIDYDIAERVMTVTKHGDIRTRATGINDELETKLTKEQIIYSLINSFKEFFGEDIEKVEVENLINKNELSQLTEKFSSDKWLKQAILWLK